MRRRPLVKGLSWLAMLLMLAFCVSDAWARGGRGGGGGRSMSRGGSASRGSFGGASRGSYSRGASRSRGSYSGDRSLGGFSRQPSRTPSQRPSTLPAGGLGQARPPQPPSAGLGQGRPATRPGGGQIGQGERPSQLPGQGERPSQPDREGAREDWQQHRQEMQDDRQQAAGARQENRQEYGEDYWEEGGAYWHGGVWVGDWDEVHVIHIDDDEDVEWAGVVAGFTLGTMVSAATFQSATSEAGCTLSEVQVNGQTYFHCGNTWYSRAMQEGEVRYLVVPPPPGF